MCIHIILARRLFYILPSFQIYICLTPRLLTWGYNSYCFVSNNCKICAVLLLLSFREKIYVCVTFVLTTAASTQLWNNVACFRTCSSDPTGFITVCRRQNVLVSSFLKKPRVSKFCTFINPSELYCLSGLSSVCIITS
jgi:hypothetical protein